MSALRRSSCILTALTLGLLAISSPSSTGAVQDAPIAPTAVAAAPAPPAPPGDGWSDAPPYVLRHGVSAPAYQYSNAVRQAVWVLAPDHDGDGKPERVAADIIRPRGLQTSKIRVPTVMTASPYYGLQGGKEYFDNGVMKSLPEWVDNYFVPRGYASVSVDMAGTSRSTGCADTGAASDYDSIKAVVDWLNGRARAVDSRGELIRAPWSNGKVGMIGTSYVGTLPNAVAALGAAGVRTIVPEAAISSWYDYQRAGGLVKYANYSSWLARYIASDRTFPQDCKAKLLQMNAEDADETGTYNDFWSARDYRDDPPPSAGAVKSSVYLVHGLRDDNVNTPNFSRWWQELGEQGVTRKLFLHRGAHMDGFSVRRPWFVDQMHRWFDNQLMGIRNGILKAPDVSVEVGPKTYATGDSWPAGGQATVLRPQANGSLGVGSPGRGKASFTNLPRAQETEQVETGADSNRLLYVSPPLAHDTRISGTAHFSARVGTEVPDGQLAVLLVDYGRARRVNPYDSWLGYHSSCWGGSTEWDSACYTDVHEPTIVSGLEILARGWLRTVEGSQRAEIDLEPDDTSVLAGHRLGLVVVSHHDWYQSPDHTRSRYTVDLATASLRIGGSVSFAGASDPKTIAALAPHVPPSWVSPKPTKRAP